MKMLKILSVAMIFFAGLFLVSCEKDTWENTKTETEVSFGVMNVTSQLKSDAADIECSGEEPVKAHIVIDGDLFTPSVFVHSDGNLYTQVIKLPSGTYTVESFMLLDANDNVVSATPMTGSEYAIYVSETVSFELVVPEFDKIERTVEVLCYNEAEFSSFGFSWFNIGQVEVHQLLFFGDLCYDPSLFVGSIYDELFDLSLYPFDIIALFEIRTFAWDADADDWKSLKVFSNVGNPNSPLVTEWFTHSSGVVDFKFELWVHTNTDMVFVHEFLFNSENPLTPVSNNVVDFVIGDCVYGGTPPQFQFPEIELPDQIQGPVIVGSIDGCSEKLAQARWRNFRNNNTGWDMASGIKLIGDNTLFSESDWGTSLQYNLDGTPNLITVEFDGDELIVSVDINGTLRSVSHVVGNLENSDYMEIFLRSNVNQTVSLENVLLDGILLDETFVSSNNTMLIWSVINYDFSQPFILTADLIIDGESSNQEGARVDISIMEIVECE